MEDIKIPVASPRKSVQEISKNTIMLPEINIESHEDIISEIENGLHDLSETTQEKALVHASPEEEKILDSKGDATQEIEEVAADDNRLENEAAAEDKSLINEASTDDKNLENEAAADDKSLESEVLVELESVIDAAEDATDELTLSEALVRAHFPELLEQPHEIIEMANDEGQVIEQWYSVEPQKAATNVEVLEQLKDEVQDEADKADIKKLLAWAKSSKKKKTTTMIIREKKRVEMYRAAVDVDAVPIIIEDSSEKYDRHGNSGVPSKRFDVKPAQQDFQVRRKSSIQPVSETVVTRSWLENAIRTYEDEEQIILVQMRFDRRDGAYQAYIQAEVGPDKISKNYEWIIKKAPRSRDDCQGGDNKDTFMIAEFGEKLVRFVAGQKRNRVPGKITSPFTWQLPFQPVIYADSQYAIFHDMSGFKIQADETGLDLEHMKLALKSLAKLHAMSYAYFNDSNADIKEFSATLKLMIDKYYQPSASSEDRALAKERLVEKFDNLLRVVSATPNGVEVAKKAKSKIRDRLYAIYKDAHATSSSFSVLCHGYPIQENFMFSYQADDDEFSRGRPKEAKLVNFQEARFANAMTDVQILLCSSMGPKVEEQGEFLLRFVYHETLIATLKSLGTELPKSIDFDGLMADFKKHKVFGSLSAAMHLAGKASGQSNMGSKPTTKRVFKSKILGGIIGTGDPKIYETSTPSLRARALMEKLVVT